MVNGTGGYPEFPGFGFDEAWAIGVDLVRVARAEGLSVAIEVFAFGQVLFHASLPGTSPDNEGWIRRKRGLALRFHESSLAVKERLLEKGTTLEERYGLSPADYAASGGSVPIRIRGAGVVGAITVSGLPDHEDHRRVEEAMRRHLAGLDGGDRPAGP